MARCTGYTLQEHAIIIFINFAIHVRPTRAIFSTTWPSGRHLRQKNQSMKQPSNQSTIKQSDQFKSNIKSCRINSNLTKSNRIKSNSITQSINPSIHPSIYPSIRSSASLHHRRRHRSGSSSSSGSSSGSGAGRHPIQSH